MPGERFIVGWSGKLPSDGDYLVSPLVQGVQGWFDDWADRGIVPVLEAGGPAADAFLTSEIVAFVASSGITGTRPSIGVIGPGMDRRGRLFPFLIAGDAPVDLEPEATYAKNTTWFSRAAEIFVAALQPGFDHRNLETHLSPLTDPQPDWASGTEGCTPVAYGAPSQRMQLAWSLPELPQLLRIPGHLLGTRQPRQADGAVDHDN